MEEAEYKTIEQKYLEIAERVIREYNEKHPFMKSIHIPEAIKTLKRMKEYKKEHLLFLRNFSVPFDNNEAERQARVCKLYKKVSGQCATLETGKHKMAMLSVLQTAKKQKLNTLEALENILDSGWPQNQPAVLSWSDFLFPHFSVNSYWKLWK